MSKYLVLTFDNWFPEDGWLKVHETDNVLEAVLVGRKQAWVTEDNVRIEDTDTLRTVWAHHQTQASEDVPLVSAPDWLAEDRNLSDHLVHGAQYDGPMLPSPSNETWNLGFSYQYTDQARRLAAEYEFYTKPENVAKEFPNG